MCIVQIIALESALASPALSVAKSPNPDPDPNRSPTPDLVICCSDT